MPNYAVNCTTESAIYVMELWLWDECLTDFTDLNHCILHSLG